MSERADFLLEIGCEDLPSGDIRLMKAKIFTELTESISESQTKPWVEKTGNKIIDKGLMKGDLDDVIKKSYATARRLIVVMENVPTYTTARFDIFRGPKEEQGKDKDGNWSIASQKFAEKNKVEPSDLELLDFNGVLCWSVKKEKPPTKIIDLLPEFIRQAIKPLVFISKDYNIREMRWGRSEFAFPRPIRWIVALLGDQVIDFEIAGVRNGNISYGHRFLAPEPFTVTGANQYLQELSKRFVLLDGQERRRIIREHGDKLAAKHSARIVWDEELLDVVADQVEYPQVLIGEFPPEYAELPRSLISATLTGYQKYFPLEDATGKLLPYFLAIYDSSPEAEANVRRGNQSALSARLADAKFFYEHDLNMGLATMRKHLAGRGYLPGVGSVLDKSERLIHLTTFLTDDIEKNNPGFTVDREALKKAAEYCKADLESAVVGEKEFAHLQGEMGFHYTLAEGLPAATAQAIREHYNPRAAGDPPASTMEGRILSLADKFDHVAALAVIGKLPRGGDDPFAARRAALGIIINLVGINEAEIAQKTVVKGLNLSLNCSLNSALELFKSAGKDLDLAENFIRARFINLIDDDQIIRKDFLTGIETLHGDNISSCYHRILLVENAIENLPEWQPLAEAAKRCRNILDAAERDGIQFSGFKTELFSLPEEKELARTFTTVQRNLPTPDLIGTELAHFETLSQLRDPLHEFFAKVFVMVEDTTVRDNRLGLLKSVYDLLGNIMDFSKIEIVTKKDN